MKELHLVCNAHIDPCWQWDVEEGIACTLSTFRCAADFCEEYDTLIFNHNEALLYQWVEEYEPKLFERIKKLVSEGRWHIMGGWYLQPDCNLPSGESFVRQILKGRMYFKEKFNAAAAAAVNVDSFGHTRGLVQILKKSGYDSYVFCRPFHKNMPLETDDFIWKGYDGSEIRAFRTYGIYNSLYGMAEGKIREWLEVFPNKDTGCVFWGVGDHGGGPSRIDLDAISKLQSQLMDRKIIHSTPEAYFQKTGESGRTLPVWDKGLNHWGPGCYTSMVRIKQKHRQLESLYYMAEKMAVHAAIAAGMAYPEQAFDEALKALMFAQFHDILPGTAIRAVEETGIRKLDYGLELMREVTSKCFFALCRGQKKAEDGEIPVLIYNPHPYAVEGIFECEFMLANMNVSGTFMNPVVYQGNLRLPSQCEKEESNFPMDWRKKVVFQAVLRPGQINRFDVRLEEMESELSRNKLDVIHLADKFLQPDKKFDFHVNGLSLPLKMPFGKPEPDLKETDGYLNFSGIHYHGKINCKTGYMEFLSLGDEVIFSGPSVVPIVFQDTMDSWAGDMTGFQCEKGRFILASDKTAARMAGTKGPLSPVRVVEDGEVRTVVEASMVYNDSFMCITYSLPKKDKAIEISFKVCWNEKDTMIKIALPVSFPVTDCTAQTSYGSEMTARDGHEAYMQQWCALWGDGAGMAVINDGIYGFSCKDNIMYITLLRSPAYAAHPSPSPAIQCAADYSNIPRMDQGEQFFSFRIMADSSDNLKADISRYAQAFNEKPYVLSLFPEGPEAGMEPFMYLSPDSSILAGAFKKAENDNGYILRLFEAAGLPEETLVAIPALGIKQKAVLKPFEIRTYRCTENKMEVCSLMEEQCAGDGILRLMENRVRRMYRGGGGIEKIHGRTPLDSDCPEEWIGSVVEAGNSEMQPVNREGISKVYQNGVCKYLDEVLAENPDYYLGKAHYEALGLTTGVLVKFLDSAMRLALQAHPDRSYAKKYLNSPWGKMECYYILDVREHIEPYIYLGFQHAPTRAEWKRMVETQDLEAMGGCFEKIKVGKGEFWYIPPGLVHAIGEGITMLEIMEPSDWVIRCEFELQKGRRLPYEARYMKKSIDEVLDIFDYNEYSVDEIRRKACLEPEIITDTPNLKRLRMISEERTGCFGVEVMDIYANQRIYKGQQPAVIIILKGSGTLSCNQSQLHIKAGDSFFAAGVEESFQVMLSSGLPVKLCMVMPKKY